MTPFLSARKRVEEFADVVDAVLATASGAAARPPTTLEPLLDVVVALRSVPVPAPRPEFTALLRQRLLADAVTVLAPGPGEAPSQTRLPPPGRSRRPSRVVVAATAIVAVGGSAGVATAAQGALPGDALYPVKRALEG